MKELELTSNAALTDVNPENQTCRLTKTMRFKKYKNDAYKKKVSAVLFSMIKAHRFSFT